MKRDRIVRDDFPAAGEGFDRASVTAHLAAVDAMVGALEAQISALELEHEVLRRQAAGAAQLETPSLAAPEPVTKPPVAPAADEVSARLVATKMTLDGADREEIRLKLSEGYLLDDLDALLDDIIERVG